MLTTCQAPPFAVVESAKPIPGLAERLLFSAEVGRADSYYRLARIVARVLVGRHLKQRRKWCDLARLLAADPGVEPRLVRQAMNWLTGGASLS